MLQALFDFFVNLLIYAVAFVAGNISGYYQKFNVYEWSKETIWPVVRRKAAAFTIVIKPWYVKAKDYVYQQIWPYVNQKKTMVSEKVRHYEQGVLYGSSEERKED